MSIPEIFQYQFMIRAFVAGGIIAIIAPLIGNFLVVRRYSLMADTLAHVALLGVAIGVLLDRQPVISAIVVTVLAALAIERLRGAKRIFGESVLAIFLSGSLAVAAVLLSAVNGLNVDLLSFLFGSITTVSTLDVQVVVALGAIVVSILFLFYKEFFFISFDEEMAKANGLRVRIANATLVVLAAITVALAMRIVGVLLIGALMVIPVITAMQIAKSFKHGIVLSIIFSMVSVFGGLLLSYYLDLASGGTIVVIALFFFILSSTVKKRL